MNLGEFTSDKITSPGKSGNPESIKKYLQQFQIFPTNVPIVGEDSSYIWTGLGQDLPCLFLTKSLFSLKMQFHNFLLYKNT